MTGRQIADAINEMRTLKSSLTPKKLAPILTHLGVKAVIRHKQNVYEGLSSIETGQGEITTSKTPVTTTTSPQVPFLSPENASGDNFLMEDDPGDGFGGGH